MNGYTRLMQAFLDDQGHLDNDVPAFVYLFELRSEDLQSVWHVSSLE